jgi:Brp/Blh family beta-carotene 15,15'-monooxygenase
MKTPPSNMTLLERLVFPVTALLVATILSLAPDVLSASMQIVLLAIVVATLGLPHGALDPWIAKQAGLAKSTKALVVFNVAYLGLAALVVLIWMWAPVTSLAVFLIISAWHFSGDWQTDVHGALRVSVGLMLLLMPIGFHTEQVAMLFTHISGPGGAELARFLAIPPWLLGLAMAAATAMACWHKRWLAALEYLGLLVLAFTTAPLVYFALYFCLLHSPRHLLGVFRQAGPKVRGTLIYTTLIYTLATLVLAGLLAWLWSAVALDSLLLRLVFIGLAAVTVPHMALIAIAHLRARQSILTR